MSILRFLFILILCVLPGNGISLAGTRDGTLRTTAGTTLKGAVEIVTNGVSIRAAGGEPAFVPVEQWAELILTEPPVVPPVVAAPPAPPAQSTNPPPAPAPAPGPSVAPSVAPGPEGLAVPGWTATAIGPGASGRVVAEAGEWTSTARGAGLRGNSDHFYLLERRMEVSGQIVGSLTSVASTNAEAVAGLMLRDNLGESAAYAFLGYRGGSGVCFQYRQIAGGMTMRVTNLAMAFPSWLRMSRMGGAVVAEISTNGRAWHPFGQANVNLGRSARAGMAVAAGTDDTEITARFREPTVGAGGLGYAPASGYPRLAMRGGSILIAPVESADESVVRLGGAFGGELVSMLNIARIEFLAPTPELEARLDADRPGLVLADGDFLDGTVRGIATNVVTMSSLLHGFRRYSVGNEAAAIQVGPMEAEETAFRVRTRNGSELRARRVEAGAGTVRMESPLLGALTVSAEEISSIRRMPPGR